MKKQLKFKVGDKVIYNRGAGGFSPTFENGIIIFAHKLRHSKLPPYIVATKSSDWFSLERDLKHEQ